MTRTTTLPSEEAQWEGLHPEPVPVGTLRDKNWGLC